MDCSLPGLTVLHYLSEFVQTHVCLVNDAIQPSHPLLPPSLPALNLSQYQGFYPSLIPVGSFGKLGSPGAPWQGISDPGGWCYRNWRCFLSDLESGIQYQLSSAAQSCPTLWDPRTTAHQASLSITSSQSMLKLMSIESVMPSNHLILCCFFFFCFNLSQHQGLFQ